MELFTLKSLPPIPMLHEWFSLALQTCENEKLDFHLLGTLLTLSFRLVHETEHETEQLLPPLAPRQFNVNILHCHKSSSQTLQANESESVRFCVLTLHYLLTLRPFNCTPELLHEYLSRVLTLYPGIVLRFKSTQFFQHKFESISFQYANPLIISLFRHEIANPFFIHECSTTTSKLKLNGERKKFLHYLLSTNVYFMKQRKYNWLLLLFWMRVKFLLKLWTQRLYSPPSPPSLSLSLPLTSSESNGAWEGGALYRKKALEWEGRRCLP